MGFGVKLQSIYFVDNRLEDCIIDVVKITTNHMSHSDMASSLVVWPQLNIVEV